MLSIAGDQVPVIAGLFVEDVGSAVIVAPEQKGPTGVKFGVAGAFTFTVIVAVVAQVGVDIELGVNV